MDKSSQMPLLWKLTLPDLLQQLIANLVSLQVLQIALSVLIELSDLSWILFLIVMKCSDDFLFYQKDLPTIPRTNMVLPNQGFVVQSLTLMARPMAWLNCRMATRALV